jgi:hypothetical protein
LPVNPMTYLPGQRLMDSANHFAEMNAARL